jgi:hypothetical protein
VLEKGQFMSKEISWSLQLSVRSGQLESARALMDEMVKSTLEESGAKNYEWFISKEGSTCHINERYSDSDAGLLHAGIFGSKFADRFMACFEPTGMFVYGEPSAELRAVLDTLGASYFVPFGGFSR